MKKKTPITNSTALSTPSSTVLSWVRKKAARLLTQTTVTKYGVVTERSGKETVLVEPGEPEELELSGGRFFRVQHKHGPFILAAELLARYHVLEQATQKATAAPAETADEGSY